MLAKQLLIALVIGPMLGCAAPLLHEVAMRAVPSSDTVAGSQIDNSQDLRAAEWNTEGPANRNPRKASVFPTVLVGTVFDESRSPTISLVAYDSEVHLLPPVSKPPVAGNLTIDGDQITAGASPLGVGNDQSDSVANLDVHVAPENQTQSQDFARYQQRPIVYNLLTDERNFYRCASLEWLAAGIGVSAILANTHMDLAFRDSYGEVFRPADRDLDFLKQFGNGQFVIPALAAIWAVDFEFDRLMGDEPWASSTWLEEWSGRSLRGLLVGAAPVVSLQYLIGSSRPSEGGNSRWEPFKSTHGVSGHAFVGAVPFWTAAQMTDCSALELSFYTAGTLAGWSRIHTDSHYLSQVLLGWWIAGLSVSAVNHTELEKHHWYVIPAVDDGSAGITMTHLY